MNFRLLDEIVDYLLGPRLWIPKTDYPDFEEWLGKVHQEMRKDFKRAIIALSCHEIVGVIIYQRHKQLPNSLELKNLSVRPDQRGRYIASFLIRNAEIEGFQEFQTAKVVCDVKARNFPMRFFLQRHGYRMLTREDLYKLGAGEDIVFCKDLSRIK